MNSAHTITAIATVALVVATILLWMQTKQYTKITMNLAKLNFLMFEWQRKNDELKKILISGQPRSREVMKLDRLIDILHTESEELWSTLFPDGWNSYQEYCNEVNQKLGPSANP